MSPNYPLKQCDVLIIGGGGSGALAAVEASRHKDLRIILASKGPVGKSGLTPTANGGTAFHDSPEETFREMVQAGAFLNDQSLVWLLAQKAAGAIETLEGFGIRTTPIRPASRCVLPDDLLPMCRRKIIRAPNVELMEDVLITRLLGSGEGVSGATGLDLRTGDFFVVQAKAIIIATGGLVGELYPHTSNNPFGVSTDSSGTGHAMAYLAGADLLDLEMIQFVPLPGDMRCRNLRYFPEFWDGPYTNKKGEVVESRVDSYQGKSYNPLFVQKLYREMEKGSGPIYVDRRGMPRTHSALKVKSWERRRRFIRNLGIDPYENTISILIGSHFCMGGIKVSERLETTVSGLFAAGEVMGGVHGGLRLPGYSFTQMIVFGFEAGKHAAQYALGLNRFQKLPGGTIEEEKKRLNGYLHPKEGGSTLGELKRDLQKIMEDHVFLFRERTGLEKAKSAIGELKDRASRLAAPGFKRFNLEWARSTEFSLMLEMAEIITESALLREESRGFHFRRDFPERNDKDWLKHTTVRRGSDGRPISRTMPVQLLRLGPEG
ncbi:MAG: FAD-binding protein [Deltaproteobacteria bacterium]|nr:FAD-binding protein [Deltaproteobacteria bacterium]